MTHRNKLNFDFLAHVSTGIATVSELVSESVWPYWLLRTPFPSFSNSDLQL